MRKWQDVKLSPDMTILHAIKIIDESSQQIGLVVSEENKLIGTVTDGDIRRAIISGIGLNEPVHIIMNTNPSTVSVEVTKEKVLSLMKEKKLRQIPVLNSEKCLIGLQVLDELLQSDHIENWVILMAGGLGSRLGDLTKQCPKPLIPVGGKPLLEIIVENFKDSGFSNFYFSVNYKAEMIEQYFGNGSKLDVNIQYLKENKRLGTAGALSLLEKMPDKPIIVMNGDLLTKVNFKQLLDYHMHNKALATMCVREYSFQVPYGVVRIENGSLQGIDEKPIQNFFVSAGIYVIEPKALELIPKDSYYDMPSLFDTIIQSGSKANVFPIREYWIDIGKRDDLERANGEYEEVFGE